MNPSTDFRGAFAQYKAARERRWFPSHVLQEFFSREWAHRIWTLQEILLATNPVICCGTKLLPWRELLHSLAFLQHSNRHFQITLPTEGCYRWYGLVTIWLALRRPGRRELSVEAGVATGSGRHTIQDRLKDYIEFLDKLARCYSRIIRLAYLFAFILGLASIGLFGYLMFRADLSTLVEMYVLPAAATVALFVIIPGAGIFLRRRESPGLAAPLFRRLDSVAFAEALVHEIAARKATNAKDHVFGTHSILRKMGIRLPDPDYSKTRQVVNRELFDRVLPSWGSLNLLLLCPPCGPGQPTWVPDWSMDLAQSWLDPACLAGKANRDPLPPSPLRYDILREEGLLVYGRQVNSIGWRCGDFRSTSMTYDDEERESHLHNIRELQQLIRRSRWSRQWFPNYGRGRDIFINTKEVLNGKYSLNLNRQYRSWVQLMKRTSTTSAEDALQCLRSSPSSLLEFHAAVCNDLVHKSRSLFCPSNMQQRWGMGNCPKQAQVGDAIVLVSGVHLPLVLRKREQTFARTLIGFTEMMMPPELEGAEGRRNSWVESGRRKMQHRLGLGDLHAIVIT